MQDDKATVIPRHVGFILDGNRRWAKSHGLPAYEGHLAGYNTLKDIAIETHARGVEYVSAYVFSTENWKRSADEVKKLMGLVLKLVTSDLPEFKERNIKLCIAGSREGVAPKILAAIDKAEQETKNNTGGTFVLCFNYGGQLEVADAVKNIIAAGIPAEKVTPELITDNLYVPDVPAVDVVVRTSGEQRLSNFMLWRAAYSEFIFLEKNWPEMTNDDVSFIMKEYTHRQRRFGG